jgi:hypothetical protein
VRNSVLRDVFGFVLVLVSLMALGFFVGHKSGVASARNGVTEPIVEGANGLQKQTTSLLQGVSRKKSTDIPVDLKNLNGKEFVDAIPTLEALARHGDLDAAHVLIQRLGSCGDYHVASDEEIRAREESKYQRELDAVKSMRASQNDRPLDPRFSDESLLRAHEADLKADFDERDVCTSLTPRQIEGRFDWIRLSLERHNRQTILDAASLNGGIGSGGIERVRNAEKLNEIAQIERSDLDALIAAGDVTALQRAANAFGRGSNSFLQRDAALAYTYAYAWTLTDTTDNAWQRQEMTALMEHLAGGQGFFPPLTPAQIDEARAQGLALFQRCCAMVR